MYQFLEFTKRKDSIKKKVCIKINLFIARQYDRFRNCTEAKISTDKLIKDMEDNEEKVSIIEENMPRLISETEKIQRRNSYLEGRVVYMFNELRVIDNLAKNGNCLAISELISQYDFTIKMEK